MEKIFNDEGFGVVPSIGLVGIAVVFGLFISGIGATNTLQDCCDYSLGLFSNSSPVEVEASQ